MSKCIISIKQEGDDDDDDDEAIKDNGPTPPVSFLLTESSAGRCNREQGGEGEGAESPGAQSVPGQERSPSGRGGLRVLSVPSGWREEPLLWRRSRLKPLPLCCLLFAEAVCGPSAPKGGPAVPDQQRRFQEDRQAGGHLLGRDETPWSPVSYSVMRLFKVLVVEERVILGSNLEKKKNLPAGG